MRKRVFVLILIFFVLFLIVINIFIRLEERKVSQNVVRHEGISNNKIFLKKESKPAGNWGISKKIGNAINLNKTPEKGETEGLEEQNTGEEKTREILLN